MWGRACELAEDACRSSVRPLELLGISVDSLKDQVNGLCVPLCTARSGHSVFRATLWDVTTTACSANPSAAPSLSSK
jgi:hypothetical protein